MMKSCKGQRKNDVSANNDVELYKVHVTYRFLVTSLLLSIMMSFGAGLLTRMNSNVNIPTVPQDSVVPFSSDHFVNREEEDSLPTPMVMDGKEVPQTIYTSKNFDTKASTTASSVMLKQNAKAMMSEDSHSQQTCTTCRDPENNTNADAIDGDDHEDEHLPAGQHLLVDIKNVDRTFLNSETRLARAMVDVVNESKLTLLSYHCHSLAPSGVSCVGVLLESHVSFHTWPQEGVITLDLFTCGSGELVPVVPLIERGFAIPQVPDYDGQKVESPQTFWVHKLRGFRPDNSKNIWTDDIGKFVVELSHVKYKRDVASTESEFQRIHIFDTIDAKNQEYSFYIKSLSNDGSYQAEHAELYKPDRIVFLEGVLQSTRLGNEAYHEALVQPAMMAHPNPKRVAIIGGGEGATLREVLKHKSLDKVIMIEIDEIMVSFSREHLPEWNDCSDIVGSADWCGDDKKADMRYEDGMAWFKNRFSDSRIQSEEYKEDKFDLLIMDALDPQDNIPFADLLYTNLPFLTSIYNALTEDGLIVMQLGVSPFHYDPEENLGKNAKRGKLTQILSKAGFKSIHLYEEAHCGFAAPWSFLVAMKSEASKKMWFRSAADINIAIHDRLIRTHSGLSPLKNFDGAMMESYQAPPKAFEIVYCKANPKPDSCKNDNVVVAQPVRKRRRIFDPYLDRHVYDKKKIGDAKDLLCDYLYYNEGMMKGNGAINFEELKKKCSE